MQESRLDRQNDEEDSRSSYGDRSIPGTVTEQRGLTQRLISPCESPSHKITRVERARFLFFVRGLWRRMAYRQLHSFVRTPVRPIHMYAATYVLYLVRPNGTTVLYCMHSYPVYTGIYIRLYFVSTG
jgi:hypothetical protein